MRAEVLDYLKAGVRLLKGVRGSHDAFVIASRILLKKDSPYTARERVLVRELVRQLSVKCEQGHRLPVQIGVDGTPPLPALKLV
ncbi:MAG: hypothetical protein QM706_14050 [Nitrospira sp.]